MSNASHPSKLFRSPFLMNREDTTLVVIDVQEKLFPHIPNHDELEWNIRRLMDGAGALGMQILITEQYPKGLGTTVSALREKSSGEIPEKSMFSCRECEQDILRLQANGIQNLLLTGIEAHVCVAQSGLDFIAAGFNVFVCVDAVGSRSALDKQVALKRMESCGATLTTTEAALFEWCERAGTDEFKIISKLVQETPPIN